MIPGLRPGAVAGPGRPGTLPARPAAAPGFTASAAAGAIASSPAHGPSTQMPLQAPQPAPAFAPRTQHAPPVAAGPARTLMGLPAAVAWDRRRSFRRAVVTRAARRPSPFGRSTAAPPRPPSSSRPPRFPAASAAAAPASIWRPRIDQKIAAIAARGPEYEAIAKLSREIIERIVWEVVPELAEVIIREELAEARPV